MSNFSFIKNICIGEAKYIPTFGFKGLFLLFKTKYRCSPNMSSQFKRKKTWIHLALPGFLESLMHQWYYANSINSTISNLFKTRGNVSSNRRVLHTKMPIRFHKRVCSTFCADQMLEQMGTFSLQACRPWGCRGCHGTPRFWQSS